MSRNTEVFFSHAPSVKINRSRFDRSSQVTMTCKVGRLYPFLVDEVLPGDTFFLDDALLCRMPTLTVPTMANIRADMYYFFVPMRLLWEDWEKMFGESDDPFAKPGQFSVPQISSPPNGWESGTLADYMGLPVGVAPKDQTYLDFSALPFRAVALCWNNYFRDESNMQAAVFSRKSQGTEGKNTSTDDYIHGIETGAVVPPICKLHDYFTSALPSAQRGDPVSIFPTPSVVTAVDFNTAYEYRGRFGLENGEDATVIYRTPGAIDDNVLLGASMSGGTTLPGGAIARDVGGEYVTGANTPSVDMSPYNLFAQSPDATVNALRIAFQTQRFYEKLAEGGARYKSLLYTMFGVTSPDARLQRAEYLGGRSVPISISQVLQTSSDSTTQYLGDTGGYSVTSTGLDRAGRYSATEHGYLIGFIAFRYEHLYQQGVEPLWNRRDFLDFYFPTFAHIGNQPIKKSEIYLTGDPDENEKTFGFKEAWAEYRYKPSRVAGLIRRGVQNSMSAWSLADYYSKTPTLGEDFIKEDPAPVDAITAKENPTFHFIVDIYMKQNWVRPMPVHSTPGLIDHF